MILVCLFAQQYGDFHERIIATLWGGGNGNLIGYGYVHGIGPIWFLLALFWSKLFFLWIYKHTNYYFLTSFIISMVALLIGSNISGCPLGILHGCSALVFYAAGVFWKKHQEQIANKNILICVACLPLWIVCILYSDLNLDTYICSLYPFTMIGAISATFIVYNICTNIPSHISSWLSWIGQNTLQILCYHTLTCLVFNRIMPSSFTRELSPLMYFFWYIFIAIGLTFVHNYVIQFVKRL